jgi:hypothetical protein
VGTGGLAAPLAGAEIVLGVGGGATLGLGLGKIITGALFSEGAGDGGGASEAPKQPTAQDIISQSKKGSINRVFPGEMLGKTMEEINKLAKGGDKIAQTARKLLTDGRFNKE